MCVTVKFKSDLDKEQFSKFADFLKYLKDDKAKKKAAEEKLKKQSSKK